MRGHNLTRDIRGKSGVRVELDVHSPGIRVPGDERFFGKCEQETVVLTVGAQGYREYPSRNVLRGTP